VADPNNYGDEPCAYDLLQPLSYEELGLEPADFLKPRPRAEIRSIFANIGHNYKIGKFTALFNHAMKLE